MARYDIGVKSGRNRTEDFERYFRKQKFYEAGAGRWVKDRCTRKEVRKIREFCQKYGLKFFYNNEYGERSSTYRYEYFRYHQPHRNGKYQCVYCGRYFPKDKITIDHIIPVAKASQSLKIQKKMKRSGIRSLNAQENLVPACWRCNQKKSDKMGVWQLRARLGSYRGLWTFRKGLRILLILLCIYILLCFFVPQIRPSFLSDFFSRFLR